MLGAAAVVCGDYGAAAVCGCAGGFSGKADLGKKTFELAEAFADFYAVVGGEVVEGEGQ